MPSKEPTTHRQLTPDEASTSPDASIKKEDEAVEELKFEMLDINSHSTAASFKSEAKGDSANVKKSSNTATNAETSSQASPAASSFEATASKAAKSEDKTNPKSKQANNSSGSSKKGTTPLNTSLTATDISHLTSIKNAVGTAGAMRPMLMMQTQMPNIPFWMEKGVLEVPVKQVNAALEYYEKLEGQGKELNEAQKKIVEEGKSVMKTLKELQEMQKGQKGVTMVDDPKEGECGVM